MSEASPAAIDLAEFFDAWPKDDSGILCKNLMLRYVNERLVQSTVTAEGNAVTAQGECGGQKALGLILLDLRKIATPKAEVKPITLSKPLRRFSGESKEPEKTTQK